jgi:hypothetical protein
MQDTSYGILSAEVLELHNRSPKCHRPKTTDVAHNTADILWNKWSVGVKLMDENFQEMLGKYKNKCKTAIFTNEYPTG